MTNNHGKRITTAVNNVLNAKTKQEYKNARHEYRLALREYERGKHS